MGTVVVNASSVGMASLGIFGRCGFDGHGGCNIGNGNGKRNRLTDTTIAKATKNRRLSISPLASFALADTLNSSRANFYQEVLKAARREFTSEISSHPNDKDISLAKALLYIGAEDEAFMAFNREIDALSLHNERNSLAASDVPEWECAEHMPVGGKNIHKWLLELDTIAREVEAELVSREIGCDLVEVLDAVNVVLLESRGFKRSPVVADLQSAYLHSVLSSGCCSAILLSVIYIEVCRRLNLTIVGSRVGEDFLIWPPTGNPEELFRVSSGSSLFRVVNGNCVNDPRAKASDINSSSLLGLEIATKRDIIGIALANLKRLYWKRASKTNPGLMLTSPLRSVQNADDNSKKINHFNIPLLRPQDLRLAIMASERLLALQPHSWTLRREYGMMLYYSRQYKEAVQELSICMVFAPEEEAAILERFIEKLHLMQLESSWKSVGNIARLTMH